MKQLIGLILGLVILTIACSGIGPKEYTVTDAVDYDADYDKVWAAVIEVLADHQVPIDNIEKASGYVSTRDFKVPNEYADSGATPVGLKFNGPLYGTFNVFVKPRLNGGCTVKINCAYRMDIDNMYYKGSESTGVFEVKFHEALRAKLSSP